MDKEGKIAEIIVSDMGGEASIEVAYEEGVRENFIEMCGESFLLAEKEFVESIIQRTIEVIGLLTDDEVKQIANKEFYSIAFGLNSFEKIDSGAKLGLWMDFQKGEGFIAYSEILGVFTARVIGRFVDTFRQATTEFLGEIYIADMRQKKGNVC